MRKTLLLLMLCLTASLVLAQAKNEDYGLNKEGTQKITNGPVVEYTSDHSGMIAWSTKYPAGTYLAYGTDPNNLNQRTQKAWGGTNHRLEIKNLQPNTTYYFQVRSEDAKGTGNDVQSPVVSFKTVAKGSAPDRENRNLGVNGGTMTTAGTSATTSSSANYVPLYRMYGQGDHFYTTNAAEHASVSRAGAYKDEGIEGYLATTQVPGSTPLYRLIAQHGSTLDHFYTASASERQSAIQSGYRDEGVVGYIAQSQAPGTVPLYRLLGQNGDHFYTKGEGERQSAISRGYKDEGVAGYVWSQPSGQ
jgi:hypothetical protein